MRLGFFLAYFRQTLPRFHMVIREQAFFDFLHEIIVVMAFCFGNRVVDPYLLDLIIEDLINL